jgi:hypothetical protein
MPGRSNDIDLAEWMKINRPEQPVAQMTGYADELERARRTGVPIQADISSYKSPTDREEPEQANSYKISILAVNGTLWRGLSCLLP